MFVNFNTLQSAHKGYNYQDLATAFFMADLLARQEGKLVVDRKLVAADRFEDVTCYLSTGSVRRQFKHSSKDRHLEREDFTQDRADLKLDKLVQAYVSLLADKVHIDEFRICVTWKAPTNADISSMLVQDGASSSSFLGYDTKRFRFDVDKLWPEGGDPSWACLRNVARQDFVGLAGLLIVETECPQFSGDFQSPGPLELELLSILAQSVGVGRYPNEHLSSRHAAELLARRAFRARSDADELTVADLEQVLDLRTDYGKVSERFPVDPSFFVQRQALQDDILGAANANRFLTVVGPPGAGKSWSLSKVADALRSQGHLVASHYCYLEPGDPEVAKRVTSNAMFGSLMAELVLGKPSLRAGSGTVYSAGADELLNMLEQAVYETPARHVYLIVDGLDHISRVVAEQPSLALEEVDIVEQFATLQLPQGVHVIFGSQPGDHLFPLRSLGAAELPLPLWSASDVAILAAKLGLLATLERNALDQEPILAGIVARSDGNPLYSTYLCREIALKFVSGEAFDPVEYLDQQVPLGGDVRLYYDHLLGSTKASLMTVANLLGATDFGITESELKEILKPIQYAVPAALSALAPILKSVSGQGGIQVYHESFRRHILETLVNQDIDLAEVLDPVIIWLKARGFFSNSKAYRFLLPLLRRLKRTDEIIETVAYDFVANSVANFQPRAAILANLNLAAAVAASTVDFPALARLAHLVASLQTCFNEKMNVRTYGAAYAVRAGAAALAERLLFDGSPTMSRADGLLLCALCDEMGGRPPWAEYLALKEESGEGPDWDPNRITVELARFRGLLRVEDWDKLYPRLVRFLNGPDQSSAYIEGVLSLVGEVLGSEALRGLRRDLRRDNLGRRLAVAQYAITLQNEGKSGAAQAATTALTVGLDIGTTLELVDAGGIPPSSFLDSLDLGRFRLSLDDDNAEMPDCESISHFVSAALILGRFRPDEVIGFQTRIRPGSRYREWLRYILKLSLAQTPDGDRVGAVEEAFAQLVSDTGPFSGKPRACDLFELHDIIRQSFVRGLRLLPLDRLEVAIRALENFSNGTTTSLQNSRGGPLTPDAFANIILPFSSKAECVEVVVKLLNEQVRDASLAAEFYETQAEHELTLSHALANAGNAGLSAQHWDSAARYLSAYGFHKDTMLFELTDSIETLALSDPVFTRVAVQRLQPMVVRATVHTDGKETQYLCNHWFAALLAIDPAAAVDLLADALALYGGRHHWILEEAVLEAAATVQLTKLPEINLYILSTQPLDDHGFEPRASAIRAIALHDKSAAEDQFQLLVAQIQGDHWQFPSHLHARATELAGELGFAIGTPDSVFPEAKSLPQTLGTDASQAPAPPQIASVPPGSSALDLMLWIRRLDPSFAWDESIANIVTSYLAPALINLANSGRVHDCVRLLRYLSRNFHFSADVYFLASLAGALETSGLNTLSGIAYTLAFAHSRGRHGWGYLGGAATRNLYEKAMLLAPAEAAATLATEAAFHLDAGHFYGVGQSIIELLADTNNLDYAKTAWSNVADVMEFRLPAPAELDRNNPFPRYTPSDKVPALDEVLFRLLLTRLSHPDVIRKQAAVTGAAAILRKNSAVATYGFSRLLRSDTPVSSLEVALRLLLDNEQQPFLVSDACKEALRQFLNSASFTLQWLAYDLLIRLGQSVPEPSGAAAASSL